MYICFCFVQKQTFSFLVKSPWKGCVTARYTCVGSLLNQYIPHGRSILYKAMQLIYHGLIFRLTLKVPVTTSADDIHKYLFIAFQRDET